MLKRLNITRDEEPTVTTSPLHSPSFVATSAAAAASLVHGEYLLAEERDLELRKKRAKVRALVMANSDSLREAQQRLARIAYIRVNSWRHFRTDTDMEMDDGHKVQNNDETLSVQHTRATAASTNNKTHSRGRCGGEKARTDVAAKPAEMQSGPAAQAEHPPALCTSTSRRPECQEVVSCSISGDVSARVPQSQRLPAHLVHKRSRTVRFPDETFQDARS